MNTMENLAQPHVFSPLSQDENGINHTPTRKIPPKRIIVFSAFFFCLLFLIAITENLIAFFTDLSSNQQFMNNILKMQESRTNQTNTLVQRVMAHINDTQASSYDDDKWLAELDT